MAEVNKEWLLSNEQVRQALRENEAKLEIKYGGANALSTNYESRKAFVDEVNSQIYRVIALAQAEHIYQKIKETMQWSKDLADQILKELNLKSEEEVRAEERRKIGEWLGEPCQHSGDDGYGVARVYCEDCHSELFDLLKQGKEIK